MLPTDGLTSIFIFSFIISFGAVISPGPVSAAIITEAPRSGWCVGPLVAIGHTFLEFIMVILIGFGLASIMGNPMVAVVISVAGGIVLLGLGSRYIYAAAKGTMNLPTTEIHSENRSARSLVSLGLATTLANPYWYTWWVTVAAGYLIQAQAMSVAAVAAFYLGHISADFFWDTSLSLASSRGKRWISERGYRILIVCTGGLMIYFGCFFILNVW